MILELMFGDKNVNVHSCLISLCGEPRCSFQSLEGRSPIDMTLSGLIECDYFHVLATGKIKVTVHYFRGYGYGDRTKEKL